MVMIRTAGCFSCLAVILIACGALVPAGVRFRAAAVDEHLSDAAKRHRTTSLVQESRSYWESAPSASDLPSGYPLSVVVHAGFRPRSSPDVSLHNITLSSFLYSFIGQWNQSNNISNVFANRSMLVSWSLDIQSFELHAQVLAVLVVNLQRLYIFLLEEDWLFEHSGILAPISDLVAVLDQHTFMTAVRFNRFSNNGELFDGEPNNWDGPCLVKDARISGDVPFLQGAGFSNNPHVSRASTMALLLEEVYDPNQTADQGLEHGSFQGRQRSPAGLYGMCAILTYDCIDKPLFLSGECDCNWRQFNNTEADVFDRKQSFMTSFIRKGEDCFNDADQRPAYDHCGLYMYGGWGDGPRISHLDGKTFSPQAFWQDPKSPLSSEKLPYFT